MKLTLAAENSILILYFLAKENGQLTARQLSQRIGAPLNHLYKLILALAKGGYVQTAQGTTGGIKLKRPAQRISLLEIIELIEGPIYLANCVFRKKTCSLIKRCVLKLKLIEAQEQLVRVLQSSTISDLVEGR
jgi:Rrf2 family protein